MDFICVILQVQGDGTYHLWIAESPNAVEFYMDPLIYGFVRCVDLKVGIDKSIAP